MSFWQQMSPFGRTWGELAFPLVGLALAAVIIAGIWYAIAALIP